MVAILVKYLAKTGWIFPPTLTCVTHPVRDA
jgi:hypothetical protein